ncbi:hypothetical protein GS498_18895 [Rhodococcus hoagii]|nr:hypothetical protein [Prescottella equi]
MLPPAVRTELVSVQRAEGLEPAARSRLLALHHRDRGDHGAALRCAAEAEDWDLAVDLLNRQAATLVNTHIDVLREALLALPAEVLDAQPGLTMLRNLVRQLSGDPSNDEARYDTADLLDLTVVEDPREALTIVGNRILSQRLGGDYETAADQTRRLHVSVGRLLDTDPELHATTLLPFLRMQSGLTYQLAGDFADSTVEMRLAHRLGAARRMDYISRNAAGNSALNWAFAGELQRAHDWLAAEARIPPPRRVDRSPRPHRRCAALRLTAIDETRPPVCGTRGRKLARSPGSRGTVAVRRDGPPAAGTPSRRANRRTDSRRSVSVSPTSGRLQTAPSCSRCSPLSRDRGVSRARRHRAGG